MTVNNEIIVRTSERTALHRCPQKWWWAWRNGLVPKEINNKLWFGAGIHVALAEWYQAGSKRGTDPAETWMRFVGREETFIRNSNGLIDQEKWVNARDMGVAMLDSYREEYGDDEEWDVIATEQQFQALIKADFGRRIVYAGTFDGVYRDTATGKLWLMEHKTALQLPNIGYLELDTQASSYFMVAENILKFQGIMKPNEKLEGITYNFLRKAMPDDRLRNERGQYLNKDGSISKVQGTARFMRHPVWRNDRQRQMTKNEIVNDVKLMLAYRNGELGITKTAMQDCSWDCDFFAMCQLHGSGDDWQEYRDAMYNKRDPYSDHRIAMKEA
jgi:hypothetical protein